MLRLTRIEEGACYVSGTTNLYVAWSMLCHSSKLFSGCETIKELDQAKSLFDKFFEKREPGAFKQLIELFQSMESPVLDAVRIVTCFENYFKARLLTKGYVIHCMDLGVCQELYPQFMTGKARKRLLQNTIPIPIDEVKRAEKHEGYRVEPLRTLTQRTLGMDLLLGRPRYRAAHSEDGAPRDQRLFSVLRKLNNNRNTLHFLNVEYIACGGLAVDDFLFLRDYVRANIDALAGRMERESRSELERGEKEVHSFLPTREDMVLDG